VLFFFLQNYFSLDASANERLGRYVNDVANRSKECNSYVKSAFINGKPHLLLLSKKKICAGDEIRYDYGGKDLPWRKVFYCVLVITSVNHDLLYVTFTFVVMN